MYFILYWVAAVIFFFYFFWCQSLNKKYNPNFVNASGPREFDGIILVGVGSLIWPITFPLITIATLYCVGSSFYNEKSKKEYEQKN